MIYLERNRDKFVNQIIEKTFPGFNGRVVVAYVTDRITFYGTMWDGGNLRTYKMIRLSDMSTQEIPQEPFMRESQAHNMSWQIPDGFVVVVYCRNGMRHSIELHGNATNITPSLPAPVELTTNENRVLHYTGALKSSYGGISNYRFHEARRETGITLAEWDEAKASLINKGFLNKAGALTTKGRNAR